MCNTLQVSTSGYHAWRKRSESRTSKERKNLAAKIKTLHSNSRNTYGSSRIHAVLLEQHDYCSRPRVASIMLEHGLKGKRKGKKNSKQTTNSKHQHAMAENKLERNFKAEKPNQKWVADITYIPTLTGWLYLAVVIDLFSRKVVGWSMSLTLEAKIVLDALEMARVSRKPSEGLLYHSDRGVQYAAGVHRAAVAKFGGISSMSRKGNCWDNAVVESFFATLKCELDLDKPIGSMSETRAMVFEWIEVWYNRERRHSSLGFLAPTVFEKKYDSRNSKSTNS
jgi:putative transposase